MLYSLLLNAIPLPDGERPASNYTLKTKLNVKVLDFVQLGGARVYCNANFAVGDFNAVSRLSDPHKPPPGLKLPGWRIGIPRPRWAVACV